MDTPALEGLAAGQARWPINYLALATFPETKYLRIMPTHREGHSKVTKAAKDALRIALFTVLKRRCWWTIRLYTRGGFADEGGSPAFPGSPAA